MTSVLRTPNERKSLEREFSSSPPKDIRVAVPHGRQRSFSPILKIEEQVPELPEPDSSEEPTLTQQRPRAATLDTQAMQKYFRKVVM